MSYQEALLLFFIYEDIGLYGIFWYIPCIRKLFLGTFKIFLPWPLLLVKNSLKFIIQHKTRKFPKPLKSHLVFAPGGSGASP